MQHRTRSMRRIAIGTLVTVALACGASPKRVTEMSPQDLLAVVGKPDAPLVLDVRSPAEFAGGHVPGARNVAFDQLASRLAELGPPRDVVVYCEGGARAAKAAAVLSDAGFTVHHLTGDMKGWRAQDLPTEK